MSVAPLELDAPEPHPHLGRVWFLRATTLLCFAGLLARLWVLEVVRYVDHERLASRNRVRYEPTESPRGGIYDRAGRLLAGNRIAHRVAILDLAREGETGADARSTAAGAGFPRPSLDEQLQRLTGLLGLSDDEVRRIRADLANPARPRFTPVTVRDDIDLPTRVKVEERQWELPNVIIEPVPFRAYPEGPRLAHVIGYVGSIGPAELARRRQRQDEEIRQLAREIAASRRELGDPASAQVEQLIERLAILRRLRDHAIAVVGKTGIEAQYERDLQGEPGIRTWQVNARSEPVAILGATAGEGGHALILNIDRDLQATAAAAFAGRRGSVVALDPRDGAVLVLYASPSYDPNLFIPKISPSDWQAILDDERHPLQDRPIRNAFPPGSTFKMVTATAGLVAGAITSGTSVSCGGGMNVGSSVKRCWATHGGGIDLIRGIALSCDTFFYRVGLRMGPEAIRATALAFGLGAPTGIDLPGEQGGRVPTEEWHRSHHHRGWYPGDTANIAIGQGDIQATCLQMASVTATVANGGQVFAPRVVREIRSRDLRTVIRPWRATLVRRLEAPPDVFARVRAGMRAAVTSGTAGPAALPNVAVAGKTGSAEDPPRRLPHAWFVCFAPYEQPTIAIAVMVENAGHGSANAAPIARAILERYFASREAGREGR